MFKFRKSFLIPSISQENLFNACSQDLERMLKQSGLEDIDVEIKPQQFRVSLTHPWFEGLFNCENGTLNVEAALSWKARAFQGLLERSIKNWLELRFQEAHI